MTSNYVVKTFGDVNAGDIILDQDGNEVEVKTAYDAHVPERMYELELENGNVIKASGNHLWYVELTEDRVSHGERLQKAKTFLASMPKVLKEGLEELSALDEPYEVTFLDILDLFDYLPDYFDYTENFAQAHFLVKRVLLSVGHISEHSQQMMDFGTGELGEEEQENLYDGRVVAQQLLALTGEKTYKKKWPVILGRVITTDEIFQDYQNVDIPVLKKRKRK